VFTTKTIGPFQDQNRIQPGGAEFDGDPLTCDPTEEENITDPAARKLCVRGAELTACRGSDAEPLLRRRSLMESQERGGDKKACLHECSPSFQQPSCRSSKYTIIPADLQAERRRFADGQTRR
jgi:hypothetical protein